MARWMKRSWLTPRMMLSGQRGEPNSVWVEPRNLHSGTRASQPLPVPFPCLVCLSHSFLPHDPHRGDNGFSL